MKLLIFCIIAGLVFVPALTEIFSVEHTVLSDSRNDYHYENGQLVKSTFRTYDRLLVDQDIHGNPVYVDYRITEYDTWVNYESMQYSLTVDKNTCEIRMFDGGYIQAGQTPQMKLNHLQKTALNGTDTWNDELVNNESCTVTINGKQIITTKDNSNQGGTKFDVIYDFEQSGFEFTYVNTNLNPEYTDQKFGNTMLCDGVKCGDISIDGNSMGIGQTRGKDELVQSNIRIGGKSFDLKEEQHGYTWELKRPEQNKSVIDFTHSKGRLNYGESLIIDPTFNSTPTSEGRITSDGAAGSSCPSGINIEDGNLHAVKNDDAVSSANSCQISWFIFDLSSIATDQGVDSAYFEFDVLTKNGDSSCMVLISDETSSGLAMYQDGVFLGDAVNGTAASSLCTDAAGDGKQISFISSAYDDIEGYFGGNISLILTMANTPRDLNDHLSQIRTSDAVLNIEYSTKTSLTTLTQTLENIGDVFRINLNATLDSERTANENFTSLEIYVNGSLTKTNSTLISVSEGETVQYLEWLQIDDTGSKNITSVLTFTNGTEPEITNSTETIDSIEYLPDYFPAQTVSEGLVNYTISRSASQNDINLKVNRDLDGATFQIECLYQTPTQAIFSNNTGTWSNTTDTGYFNDTQTGWANAHSYISCYNDDLLFTVTSYTNSSLSLLGIQAFDDVYGEFIGVPVTVFFLVLVAGYANPRTAPIWLVVVLGMAGILAQTSFITLTTEIWALALIAGILGLFVGRKFF